MLRVQRSVFKLPKLTTQHILLQKRGINDVADQNVEEHDIEAAREWLKNFNTKTIPESITSVSFSRSSGPGGQKVNK